MPAILFTLSLLFLAGCAEEPHDMDTANPQDTGWAEFSDQARSGKRGESLEGEEPGPDEALFDEEDPMAENAPEDLLDEIDEYSR